jgi:hypothetical protein
MTVFISYSRKDEELVNRLSKSFSNMMSSSGAMSTNCPGAILSLRR